MISALRQFHDEMQTCMQLDDEMCSGWFACIKGLRQKCLLPPLLFIVFFAVVIHVAYTRVKVDKYIMDTLVHLTRKSGAGGRARATTGMLALVMSLWGMFSADDAGVVSQSPEKLRKMMRRDRGHACGFWRHRTGGQDYDHTFTYEGGARGHRHTYW